jgi:epoxyqueuosine reductase
VSQAPTTSAPYLAEFFARVCHTHHIDLAGAVALPCRLPHQSAWHDWVDSGRHAGLTYLTRDSAARVDPTQVNPWANSLLVFAQLYTSGWSADDTSSHEGAAAGTPWRDGIARYARGLDYHDILLADVRGILVQLAEEVPGLQAHPAVDTGPYLEREYAWLAGLGFFGKNNCLIHERLGSGMFLAVALTNLEIAGLPPAGEPADEALWASVPRHGTAGAVGESEGAVVGWSQPVASRCGRCRLCLDACPTGALDAPFRLDARLCISTWTIEQRGRLPAGLRHKLGGLLFGCDICQAVCPWNHKAARAGRKASPRQEYATLPEHAEIDLADLVAVTPEEFRRRFRRTPLWRSHPEGMRCNAITVAANSGRNHLVGEISRVAQTDLDADVRTVAHWATDRFREEER